MFLDHFVITTDISKSLIVESFFMIWALAVWIFPFWSFIWSSISPNLSYIGKSASSVIFNSFCIFVFETWYCFLQNCNYLFIASISSLINSIDLPRGAVFWQIDWIIDFTKSSSLSVSSPALDIIFSAP